MPFGKAMDTLIFPTLGWIAPTLFFYNDGFEIELPTKVDMPLNKETEETTWRSQKFCNILALVSLQFV